MDGLVDLLGPRDMPLAVRARIAAEIDDRRATVAAIGKNLGFKAAAP